GVYRSEAMPNDLLDSYLAPWSTEEGKKALFRNFRRLNPSYTQAITDRLKDIPHKTLIIWAEKDVFQKPTYALALKKAIPHAELIWIKEAGHWLMEDRPEELNHHLAVFLNGEVARLPLLDGSSDFPGPWDSTKEMGEVSRPESQISLSLSRI
ncbi:MAG: alpha/beta hydrolase, partial [Nitrospirota bacterium]